MVWNWCWRMTRAFILTLICIPFNRREILWWNVLNRRQRECRTHDPPRLMHIQTPYPTQTCSNQENYTFHFRSKYSSTSNRAFFFTSYLYIDFSTNYCFYRLLITDNLYPSTFAININIFKPPPSPASSRYMVCGYWEKKKKNRQILPHLNVNISTQMKIINEYVLPSYIATAYCTIE